MFQFSVRLLAFAALVFSSVGFAKPPEQVIAYQVEMQTVPQSLKALGSLQAKESVNIAASVSEILKALHFEDGQQVRKSQLLIELNAQEQLAMLEEAKEVAAEAKRQYDRVKEIEGRGSVTRSLIDERYRDWKTAVAKRKVIEAQIADRRIYAPFAGRVGFHQFSVGAYVPAGTPIVTLDDTSEMKLELLLPSRYLSELKIGQPIRIQAASYPNHVFHGKLSAISPRLQQNLRMVQVQARVPNPDNRLKTNMIVEAQLVLPPQHQLTVPNSAILMVGDHQYVYRLTAGQNGLYRTEKIEIVTGTRGYQSTEVQKGLAPGDIVVSQGVMNVSTQQSVKIKVMQKHQPQAQLLQPAKRAPETRASPSVQ
ncbi:MAG: efflux RND transporter periplasmic adaptor subunit [Hydrogenovibrio sp.]|nr:efflux RND transporter periplasmic adaptor subunit [Hydrogenovibrio sp.]